MKFSGEKISKEEVEALVPLAAWSEQYRSIPQQLMVGEEYVVEKTYTESDLAHTRRVLSSVGQFQDLLPDEKIITNVYEKEKRLAILTIMGQLAMHQQAVAKDAGFPLTAEVFYDQVLQDFQLINWPLKDHELFHFTVWTERRLQQRFMDVKSLTILMGYIAQVLDRHIESGQIKQAIATDLRELIMKENVRTK